jgi:hypothetical protein
LKHVAELLEDRSSARGTVATDRDRASRRGLPRTYEVVRDGTTRS